jgi:hypothetical protein
MPGITITGVLPSAEENDKIVRNACAMGDFANSRPPNNVNHAKKPSR